MRTISIVLTLSILLSLPCFPSDSKTKEVDCEKTCAKLNKKTPRDTSIPPTGAWKIYYYSNNEMREGVITSFATNICFKTVEGTDIYKSGEICKNDNTYNLFYSIFISEGNDLNTSTTPSFGCLATIETSMPNKLECIKSGAPLFEIAPVYNDTTENYCKKLYDLRIGTDQTPANPAYGGIITKDEAQKFDYNDPICFRLYTVDGPGPGTGTAGNTGGN